METLRRFRATAIWVAAVATVAATCAVYPFDSLLAKTLFVGGVVGIVTFWAEAYRTEKMLTFSTKKVKAFAYRWAFVRMSLYGGVLLWAHALDHESARGMLGACFGLFAIRIVIIFLGVTGLGMNRAQDEGGE